MESGYSVPLRVLGHGPFLNKNAQPASKSYLVLGKRQAPLGWAGADSILLSHCFSGEGNKSALEGAPLCPVCGPLCLPFFCRFEGITIRVSESLCP